MTAPSETVTTFDLTIIEDGERRLEETFTGINARKDLNTTFIEQIKKYVNDVDIDSTIHGGATTETLDDFLRDNTELDIYLEEHRVKPLHAVITNFNDGDGTVVTVYADPAALYADLRQRITDLSEGDPDATDVANVEDSALADIFESEILAPTRGTVLIQKLEPRHDGSFVTEGM